jgi:hypothetical protein
VTFTSKVESWALGFGDGVGANATLWVCCCIARALCLLVRNELEAWASGFGIGADFGLCYL